jgi:hypothetical protein
MSSPFVLSLHVIRSTLAGDGRDSHDTNPYKKLTAGGGSGIDDLILSEEGIQMTSIGSSSINHSHNVPPTWVSDVEHIQNTVVEIQQRMEQLQSMHATRVGSVFGKDLHDMEGRIETLTQNITDQFRYAERLLSKVGMATRQAGGEQATIGANVQRRSVR